MTTFRSLSDSGVKIRLVTCDLSLSDVTLRLSTLAVTLSAVRYQPLLLSIGDADISAGGDSGMNKTADFTFEVFNRKLESQAAGKRFEDLLLDYDFVGAIVVFKQHLQDSLGVWYSDQFIRGEVQNWEVSRTSIKFKVLCGQEYNTFFPPLLFRAEDTGMSRVPKDTLATPVPIIAGDFWNTVDTSEGLTPEMVESMGIVRNAVPVMLYDPFDDTNKSHIYRACGNKCHTVPSGPSGDHDGVFLFERGIDTLCSLELGLSSFVDGADYVDVKLTRPIYAEAIIKPGSWATAVTNPRNAIDRDETTYATITYSSPYRAEFDMEAAADLGDIVEMRVQALARVTTGSDKNLEVGCFTDDVGSTEYTGYTAGAAWPSITFISHVIGDTNIRANGWSMRNSAGSPLRIYVGFGDVPTSGVARLYEICVRVKYRPAALRGIQEVRTTSAKVKQPWGGGWGGWRR